MAEIAGPVTGGVDTHAGTHVAAVVDQVGRVLGTESFPAGADGYAGLLAWLRGHGVLARVGVEGTGSYGAGLARFLASQDVPVLEVPRPDRQRRRRRGKSDAVDAVSAAIAALSGEDCGTPKSGDGAAESIRALRVARVGAMKARTQAGNQLRDLITTAPERLRAELSHLSTPRRVRAAAAFTCGDAGDPAEGAKAAMASVARRWQDLDTEITRLEAVLEQLVARVAAPEYLALTGVGTCPWPPSPPCAASAQSTAPPASRNGTGSTTAGTGRPTPRCGGSPSPASGTILAPRTTTPAAPPRARHARKSSASSSATPPARPTASSSGPASPKPPRSRPRRPPDNTLTCSDPPAVGHRPSAAGVSGMPPTRASRASHRMPRCRLTINVR
jgi:transposase